RSADRRWPEQEQRRGARDPQIAPSPPCPPAEAEQPVPAASEESSGHDGSEAPLAAASPEERTGPVPNSSENEDGPTTGQMRAVGRPRTNRAQSLPVQSRALGLGVRQSRRSPQSTRRPRSYKP